MNINGTEITTPTDDLVGFQLDWHHRVATAAARTLPLMGSDPDLKAYYQHLRNRPSAKFNRITAWRGTVTGQLLEAYLLTGSPHPAIAVELGLDCEDVRLYGIIFWAVRDLKDTPLKGVLLRLRAALPREPREDDRLMRASLLGGLEGLRGQLGTTRNGSDLSAIVEQELTRRAVSGELRTGDLIRLRGHDLMLRKMEIESRDEREQDQSSTKLLFELLEKMAPRMMPNDQTAEQIQATDNAIRGRIDSQRLATGIGISRDAGGTKQLNAMLKKI
ncbi:MAG: hypothetical protein WCL16_06190 [bacterium]